MSAVKIPASAVLITKDEESHLAKTLNALQDFEEVLVVDSESTDGTCSLAEREGARVFSRKFDDFSSQKNFAAEKAGQPWVFSLDSDEIPDEELLESIQEAASHPQTEVAWRVHRKNFHFGSELRWGGQGKDDPIRLFRKGSGRFVGRVHEHLEAQGRVGRLRGSLCHESNRSVSEYLGKLEVYSGLEAGLLKERKKRNDARAIFAPFFRFMYVYFIQLGFLDGFEGFLFHALSSFQMVIRECRAFEETSS